MGTLQLGGTGGALTCFQNIVQYCSSSVSTNYTISFQSIYGLEIDKSFQIFLQRSFTLKVTYVTQILQLVNSFRLVVFNKG